MFDLQVQKHICAFIQVLLLAQDRGEKKNLTLSLDNILKIILTIYLRHRHPRPAPYISVIVIHRYQAVRMVYQVAVSFVVALRAGV